MPKRGTKAKPRGRHAHEGTRAQQKGSDLRTKNRGRLPAPPKYLPREAKEFWKKAVKWMDELGVADSCDVMHLEAAAMMWHRLREANRTLVKEGLFQKNEKTGMSKRHPAAIEAVQMTEKLRMWYGEVGFTPAARAALGQGRAPESDGKDLEGRIFGKGKPDLKVS